VAAYELTQAGHDVTILEAQLRPGGRVLTLREPFSDGLYAEAGAARIPDNHDLTLHYVKHFGLTLVPFYPDKLARVFVLRGKRIRIQPGTELDLSQVPFELTAEERRLGMSGLLQKYLGGALRAMGDPSVPDWPSGSAKAYDNISMPEFLRQQGASHVLLNYWNIRTQAPKMTLPLFYGPCVRTGMKRKRQHDTKLVAGMTCCQRPLRPSSKRRFTTDLQ